MAEETRIRVKVPQRPPEELAAIAGELEPVLGDLARWVESGQIGSPVAVVVSDSRYPMLPALSELEEPEVVFYDRDAGYAKRLERGGEK